MFPDVIPLIILASFFFLLYKAFKSRNERSFADLSDAGADLVLWQTMHQYIHPGDYTIGRQLAERYRDTLLAAYATSTNDPEYLAELEYATRMAAPRRSGSFHAVA